MKKYFLNIGYILSIATIISCSTNSKMQADLENSRKQNTGLSAILNKDGITIGKWKNCNQGDELCFQKKLMEHISKNFKYPTEARLEKYLGKVYVKFEWDEQGILDKSSITIVRSSGHDILDQNAKDLALTLPNFDTPSTKDGKPVRFSYTLPIRYKIV